MEINYSIDELLGQMVEWDASDLHLTVGAPPVVRVHGSLRRIENLPPLNPDHARQLLYRIMSSEQQKHLEVKRQLDMAYSVAGVARFRVNVYFQRGSLGAAFRLTPMTPKTIGDLNLPPAIKELAERPNGLVLVTGATGSGKTTTLAAMIDWINESRSQHVLTIEDPIEFIHRHKSCIVNQREVGHDAIGFADALRSALRQDPDVILLGEMRDLETISTALTAAETGHLVLATLHTQGAAGTIDRVVDVFPPGQQMQVRLQLSTTLQGIVCQSLLPRLDGQGRIPAIEILLPDDGVRNLIRQSKVEQVYSVMQTGTARGMQTLEQALADLVRRGIVTLNVALTRTSRPEILQQLIEGGGPNLQQSAALRAAGA